MTVCVFFLTWHDYPSVMYLGRKSFYIIYITSTINASGNTEITRFHMYNWNSIAVLSVDKISNVVFYQRYVDDILAVFSNRRHIAHFKRRFRNAFILKFTHESMDNNVIHFLDLKFVIDEFGQFNTSVYIKPTDKGLYTNYNSYIPDTYKNQLQKPWCGNQILI